MDTIQGIDRLRVFAPKNKLPVSFRSDGGMEYFARFEPKKLKGYEGNLLITIWNHGAHSEVMRIFDLKRRKVVFEETSAWPFKWREAKSRLYIESTATADDTGLYKSSVVRWPK